MEAIPIVFFWGITAWILMQRKHALIYLFFASMPFGSFAAIPTELTGGLTLTPTPIVAIVLIAVQLGSSQGIAKALNAALMPSKLLLLFLFWTLAAITTIFMPRFFAGVIHIVPVRTGAYGDVALLEPSLQNISQFLYVSISVLTVFAFLDMLRTDQMRRHILPALALGASLTIFTGMLDYASQFLPLEPILETFRTATYSLLTNVESMDGKRVVGLMPEASSYGSLSLTFLTSLYFFRRALDDGWLRDYAIPLLMLLLFGLIWLSTSSAAYLGLALFVMAVIAEWIWRMMGSAGNSYIRRGRLNDFWTGAIAAVGILLMMIVNPERFAPIAEMLDVTIFQKSGSSSFEERTMWTKVSWNALLDTRGLGVGLGGTRASNFAVALASNAGAIAALLYFGFVIQCLSRKVLAGDRRGAALLSAVRWSYMPPFFTSLLIGSTPDFGVFNAFYYGCAFSIAYKFFWVKSFPVSSALITVHHPKGQSLTLARAERHGDAN